MMIMEPSSSDLSTMESSSSTGGLNNNGSPIPPSRPLARRLSMLNHPSSMERKSSESNMIIRKNKHHSIAGSSLIISSPSALKTTTSSSPQSPSSSTSPTSPHGMISFKNMNNSPRGGATKPSPSVVMFHTPSSPSSNAVTTTTSPSITTSLPPLVPRSSSLPPLYMNTSAMATSFSNASSNGAAENDGGVSPSSPSSQSSVESSSVHSVSSPREQLIASAVVTPSIVNRKRSSGSFGLVMEQLSTTGSPISPNPSLELHGRTRMRIDLENPTSNTTPDNKKLSRLLNRRNSFAMNGTPGSTNSTGSPSPIVVSHNEGNGSSNNANNVSPRNYNTHLHPHHLHISKSDSELMDSTNDGSSPKEHSERLPILVHHHSLRSKGEKDFNNIFGENEQAMKEMEQFSQMQSSPRLMSARISTGMSGISSPRNGEAVTNSGSSLVTSTSSPASKKPSFDRLVSSFAEIQDQRKELKKDPQFQEHMKEFSTHVRAYNTRCILNEQEIIEFISDKRDFPDELDPNILSKASDKDVKWYVTTLGEKTVNMLCEWKHRLNYLESECKDVQDFTEMKQKIEHNIKQMKETLGSVSSVTAAEHFLEMDSDIKLLQDEESKPSPPIPLRKGRSKSLISNFSSSSKPKNK